MPDAGAREPTLSQRQVTNDAAVRGSAHRDGRRQFSPFHVTAAGASQLLARAFGAATGIVVAGLMARDLGRQDFGRLSLALSLVALSANAIDLGVTPTAVSRISSHPDQTDDVAGALVLFRTITAIPAACLVVLVVCLVETSGEARLTGALVASTLLLSPLSALQPVAQSQLRLARVNTLLVAQSILWLAAVLALGAEQSRLRWYGAGFLAVSAMQGVAGWLLYRRFSRAELAAGRRELGSLLRAAIPLGAGGLLVTAYYRLDGVLLYHYKGAAANAIFSAAYRFLDTLQIIPASILTVLLPVLAIAWRDSKTEQARRRRLLHLALSISVAVSLPIAVGGAVLSKPLIALVYGSGYSHAAPVLAVLLFAFPCISVGYVSIGLTLAQQRTRSYAVVAGAAALANVVANVLLLPRYGAMAAAWTTIGTELLSAGAMLALLVHGSDCGLPGRRWLGAACASLVMGASIFPLRNGPLIVSLLAGCATYLAAAIPLGAITLGDLQSVLSRARLDWP